VPAGAAAPGAAGTAPAPAPAPPPAGGTGTTTTPATGGGNDLERRLDDVIRRQRELLREVEQLREAVRARGGG
jgi:hypothetical protein